MKTSWKLYLADEGAAVVRVKVFKSCCPSCMPGGPWEELCRTHLTDVGYISSGNTHGILWRKWGVIDLLMWTCECQLAAWLLKTSLSWSLHWTQMKETTLKHWCAGRSCSASFRQVFLIMFSRIIHTDEKIRSKAAVSSWLVSLSPAFNSSNCCKMLTSHNYFT